MAGHQRVRVTVDESPARTWEFSDSSADESIVLPVVYGLLPNRFEWPPAWILEPRFASLARSSLKP